MIKVVLNDLLVNIKKNWLQIILNTVLCVFFTGYISNIILSVSSYEVFYENGALVLNDAMLSKILVVASGIAILYLYNLTKIMPLRLSKAMFVCAAGEDEKIKYILVQLTIKIIFSFIIMFAFIYFSVGKFFINNSFIFNSIQIILWFFVILNINLKVGIGEQGARKKDKNNYIIYTKEEEIVNVYWFCLLLIEVVIFYSFAILNIGVNSIIILVWCIIFALNSFIVYKNIYPILKKSLSYEDVYCQEPERNESY